MADEPSSRLRFDASTIGSSGARVTGGYVTEEFVRDLRGAGSARTFREMADNDATVGAVIFAISMLIRSTEWTVQAADDSDQAEEAKVFVEECMQDMSVSWSTVVSEVCSMMVYGFAGLEIIWKRRTGPDAKDGSRRSAHDDWKIGIRNLSLRGQSSIVKWEITPDGGIAGMWQQPVAGPMVMIPIEKMLLFRTQEERNLPEGRSLLRTAYRSWYFKRRIEDIEAVGVERDLAGLPVCFIPGQFFGDEASTEDQATFAAWQSMVTRVKRDQQEGIVMPSTRDQQGNLLYDFKLMTSGGARSFDTGTVIDRYNRQIATSVLADFLFLGQQSVGSFALSSDKTALFATAIGGLTRAIAEVFSRHLLPRLFRLNGMDLALLPTINAGDLEKQNLGEVADFVVKLVQSGAPLFPDRELENRLRVMANLPEAPEDGPDLPGLGVPGLQADDELRLLAAE